jgi:hypothetical protein
VDVKKKAAMRSKVNEYITRAEDLKRIVYAKEEAGVEQLQNQQKIRRLDFTELSMYDISFFCNKNCDIFFHSRLCHLSLS